MPKIVFSVIDRAETREQAFKRLGENLYDIVFVNNQIDDKPIGSGMLKRFRRYHEKALFITLLDITQRKGQKKRDGTLSTGEGLQLIFNDGFYSGVFKKDMNIAYIILMILSGGRNKESAYSYYGFDGSILDKGRVYHRNGVLSQTSYVNTLEKENTPVRQDGDSKSVDLEGNNNLPEKSVKESLAFSQRNSRENGGNKMNRKERRAHDRERKEREWEEKERLEKEERVKQQKPARDHISQEIFDARKNWDATVATTDAILEKNEKYEMVQDLLRQRGQVNRELVLPGALYGRVQFGKGNTVLIELDKPLEQVGVSLAEIYNVPVVIPYTKVGSTDVQHIKSR